MSVSGEGGAQKLNDSCLSVGSADGVFYGNSSKILVLVGMKLCEHFTTEIVAGEWHK
jgi:hypothetical protein